MDIDIVLELGREYHGNAIDYTSQISIDGFITNMDIPKIHNPQGQLMDLGNPHFLWGQTICPGVFVIRDTEAFPIPFRFEGTPLETGVFQMLTANLTVHKTLHEANTEGYSLTYPSYDIRFRVENPNNNVLHPHAKYHYAVPHELLSRVATIESSLTRPKRTRKKKEG